MSNFDNFGGISPFIPPWVSLIAPAAGDADRFVEDGLCVNGGEWQEWRRRRVRRRRRTSVEDALERATDCRRRRRRRAEPRLQSRRTASWQQLQTAPAASTTTADNGSVGHGSGSTVWMGHGSRL